MTDRQHEARTYLGIVDDWTILPEVVDAICDPSPDLSAWPPETVEQIGHMTDNDRDQVLTFVAFLQAAGRAPVIGPVTTPQPRAETRGEG